MEMKLEKYSMTIHIHLVPEKLAYCYSKLCKVLSDQGLTVIMSTISMFDEVREWNRKK